MSSSHSNVETGPDANSTTHEDSSTAYDEEDDGERVEIKVFLKELNILLQMALPVALTGAVQVRCM